MLVSLTKSQQLAQLFEKIAYLLGHQYDETVILNRILSESLRVVLHDFTISNQFLRLSCVAMSCLNFVLQSTDLQHNWVSNTIDKLILFSHPLS